MSEIHVSAIRLREGRDSSAQLLRAASQVDALPAVDRTRLRASLKARVGARQHQPRAAMLSVAFVAAALVGSVATFEVLRWMSRSADRSRSSPPSLAVASAVEPTQSSAPEWHFEPGAIHGPVQNRSVELSGGGMTLSAVHSFRVTTPEVEVLVLHGRVAVARVNGVVEVTVFDGVTELSRRGRVLRLAGGEHGTSRDPRLWSDRVQVALPPADLRCAGSGANDCLARVAQVDDVRGQIALLRLAMNALETGAAEEAVRLAGSSLKRFPHGVLSPEAHLVLLQALVASGRDGEATKEGRWYLEHQPHSPAAPGVALLMGDLAIARGAWADAKTAYAAALGVEGAGDSAAEALFGMALAQSHLGDPDLARELMRRAAQASPSGPLAEDIARRLHE